MRVKSEDGIAPLALLLALSFVYGFVHASGPGHGKTLVASYFGANDKSYKRAFIIAFAIAIVHTFSALIITLIGYFLLSSIFSLAISNSTTIITKISGFVIVVLGVYFLYNKIKHYKNLHTMPKWSVTKPSCQCASCKTSDSTELALVLLAGIVPCPGTIMIFMFSTSLQLFFVGFLSALAMSFGMAVVIASTALISTKIRKSTKSNHSKLLIWLDFISVSIIILLGLLLLLV